jgi:hypothetical protein
MIYRVSRFLIDGAMVICSSCKLRAATHSVGKQKDLCCECYIAMGAAPAVWHPACVRANARKISERSVTYRADAAVPSLAHKVAVPEQYQAAGCVKVGKANTKGRVSSKP